MKTIYFYLILLFFAAAEFSAQSDSKHDSLCLQLLGKVVDPENDHLPDCYIELFDGLTVVDSIWLKNESKKFSFLLKKNRSYAIRISMEGYIPQLISVNTEFPDDIDDVVPFSFNTCPVSKRKAEKLNRDALDFPIAIVYFDRTSEEFVHNEDYTATIKKDIGIPYKVSSAEAVRHKSKGKGSHTVMSVTY